MRIVTTGAVLLPDWPVVIRVFFQPGANVLDNTGGCFLLLVMTLKAEQHRFGFQLFADLGRVRVVAIEAARPHEHSLMLCSGTRDVFLFVLVAGEAEIRDAGPQAISEW